MGYMSTLEYLISPKSEKMQLKAQALEAIKEDVERAVADNLQIFIDCNGQSIMRDIKDIKADEEQLTKRFTEYYFRKYLGYYSLLQNGEDVTWIDDLIKEN